MDKELKRAFRAAFPFTTPILTGFLFLGMAYGVLMKTKGYDVIWSVLMSLIAFCGSMQYVAITLLTVAFNPVQAFLLSIMVNARHLFYGISMLDKYKGMGKIKGFLIYTLCDETFSVVCNVEPPENVNKKYYYFAVSLLDYLYWAGGTLLGGLLGNFVTFNTNGLDFVLTALFVVIFLNQWEEAKNRRPGLVGMAVSLVCLMIFGADSFIIPSMVLITLVLLVFKGKGGDGKCI